MADMVAIIKIYFRTSSETTGGVFKTDWHEASYQQVDIKRRFIPISDMAAMVAILKASFRFLFVKRVVNSDETLHGTHWEL